MEKIKSLQIKKILKELDYIQSDFEWRNEVVSEADGSFMQSINEFLEKNPQIKELYDKKVTEKIENSIKKKIEEDEAENDGEDDANDEPIESEDEFEKEEKNTEDVENSKDISPKLKKLYREIVKLTHPDRVKKKKLNDLYIEATNYYNDDDKIGIYKICSELEIEYEIEVDDEIFIVDKIETLKKRIGFLESTFTWKWFNCKDEMEKNQIVINFIKLRIQ
jgi:hypothetical protein